MILVIDNYDSFVHNLARYFALAGHEYIIMRNDALSLDDIAANPPDAIIISPGPGTPAQAGASIDIIKRFGATIPILGVCLGHQAIGEAYGGKTSASAEPVHGKASEIVHNYSGLFKGLPNPMNVGRYHSLVTTNGAEDLLVTAQSDDGTIMAMEHKRHPVYGVQFHPESILTDHGLDIIKNFMHIATTWNKSKKAAA